MVVSASHSGQRLASTAFSTPLQPSTSTSPFDEPPAEALQLYNLYNPLQLYSYTSSTLYNPLQHPSGPVRKATVPLCDMDKREARQLAPFSLFQMDDDSPYYIGATQVVQRRTEQEEAVWYSK